MLDSDTEGSDLEAAEDRRMDGSESDVTIDDWQTELKAWDVGPGSNNNNNNSRPSAPKREQQQLIKPKTPHIHSEDDF